MDDFTASRHGSHIVRKERELYQIYDSFEKDVSEYKQGALCRKGCSFCCTFMGNVDTTTLEALIIRKRMTSLSPDENTLLSSRIEKDRAEKEMGRKSPCPFLNERSACIIYDVRPFSCRQLYSLRECEGTGATLHRQAYELSRKAITRIQQVDATGYSGHLSSILHLMEDPRLRELYVMEKLEPAHIREFGSTHGIVINSRAQNRRKASEKR